MKKQLKRLFVIVILTTLFTVHFLNGQTPPIDGNWVVIPELTDEFESGINDVKWNVRDPKWDGRFPSYFEPNNISVEDGLLNIKCREVNDQDSPPFSSKGEYTHATATYKSKTKVKYGYFEIEAKATNSKYWNSFWLYDYTDQQHTELDVVEIVATYDYLVTTAHRFYDRPDYNPPVADHHKDQKEFRKWESSDEWSEFFYDGFFAKYHKYALDWNKDYITWYIDDIEIFKVENKYYHQELYLIIDAEVDGTWPDPPPTTEEIYQIKYVRSWKNEQTAAVGDEDLNLNKINISPNPSAEKFKINYSSPYAGEVRVRLVTIDGRQISDLKLQKNKTEFEHQIDLSNLALGIYIIQLSAGEYRSFHKIIKN